MDVYDKISIIIAGVAVLVSIVIFFLNRRHARSLFEASGYPDLDLALEVLTSWKAIDNGRIIMDETYLPHLTWIEVTWHNKTKVEAVNLNALISLARGFRRLQWESHDEDWGTIPPLQYGHGTIGMEMNRALATLCPESLVLKEEDSAEVFDKWLEVRGGKEPPTLCLIVEFRWRPPVWRGKLLKKTFKAILKPQMEIGNRIESWTAEGRRGLIGLSVVKWRPRNLRLGV